MRRSVTHAPNRITTLTFSTNSPQHQLSIMTLAAHLLLSVHILLTRASWDIIQQLDTHAHTLRLVLATITLR